MIALTHDPIDSEALLRHVSLPQAGAVVLFLGTVRELTHGRRTLALDYECYPEMAEATLADLEAQARARWPIVECAIVHRLGHLKPAEASVAVAVSTPHRRQAFEAGSWLIDTLKEVVPIWKQRIGTTAAPSGCIPASRPATRRRAFSPDATGVRSSGPPETRRGDRLLRELGRKSAES